MKFAPRVKFRPEKFGGILFDTLREKVFVTNSCGREILTLLEKDFDPEEVFSALKDEYEVDPAILQADIASLLGQLRENQLVADV